MGNQVRFFKYFFAQILEILININDVGTYQGWQSAKKIGGFGSGSFSGCIAQQIPIFPQHEYLNFKIGKFLLEWQIQQISKNYKHLHEDFGIFNYPIDFKLGMMIHDTVRQNVERIGTLNSDQKVRTYNLNMLIF